MNTFYSALKIQFIVLHLFKIKPIELKLTKKINSTIPQSVLVCHAEKLTFNVKHRDANQNKRRQITAVVESPVDDTIGLF